MSHELGDVDPVVLEVYVFRLRASGLFSRTGIADSAALLGPALLQSAHLKRLNHNTHHEDDGAEGYSACNQIAGARQPVTLPPIDVLL